MKNFIMKNGEPYTKNLTPGIRVYTEKLVDFNGVEYRTWDKTKSKLAAAIVNGVKNVPIDVGTKVLYLGASTGTTTSHISDIVGKDGIIYAVEFSPRVIKDLFNVAKLRKNIVPILADARKPEKYKWVENVDVVYCDIAQPDQTRISIDNSNYFKSKYIMIAIKSQSIDVTEKPDNVYKNQISIIENSGFRVLEWTKLDPYEKDHCFIIAERL